MQFVFYLYEFEFGYVVVNNNNNAFDNGSIADNVDLYSHDDENDYGDNVNTYKFICKNHINVIITTVTISNISFSINLFILIPLIYLVSF